MADVEVKINRTHKREIAYVRDDSAEQLTHGDFGLPPIVYNTFEDAEERTEWIESLVAETPQDEDRDSKGNKEFSDIQGWTYVADYSVHPMTPRSIGNKYYIHAKISRAGKIRFGIFTSVTKGESKTKTPLAYVWADGSSAQHRHGDHYEPSPLRLAGKEEAEKKMLKGGKLIKSACPRFLGCLMNTGKAKIALHCTETIRTLDENGNLLSTENLDNGYSFALKNYFGHLWAYFGSIIDNVLYIVGLPLYDGDEGGTVVYTQSATKRIEDGDSTISHSTSRETVGLPPTADDLVSEFRGGGGLVRGDGGMFPPNHAFYKAVDGAFELSESGFFNIQRLKEEWWDKNLETETPTVWAKRPVAYVWEDGTHQQYQHGDVHTRCTLMSYLGGVYYVDGALKLATSGEANYTDVETGKDVTTARGYIGYSGFVASRTIYSLDCKELDVAQCFVVQSQGVNYRIATVGGNAAYRALPDRTCGGTDVSLTFHTSTTKVKKGNGNDDPPPPDPNDGETVEEDDYEEAEEGCLGEFFDYFLASDSGSYPIKLTRTPNSVSLEDVFQTSLPKTASAARALAAAQSYQFAVNSSSRYFKSPSFRYTVQFQADGQDGPFTASVPKNPNAQNPRTIVVTSASLSGSSGLGTASFSLGTIYGGGSGTTKTATQTVKHPETDYSSAWSLAGSSSCTALDELKAASYPGYIKIREAGLKRIKIPERWYVVSWTERWEETAMQPNGEEKVTVHICNYRRVYDNQESRDDKFNNLKSGAGLSTGHKVVGSPHRSTMASKAYVSIRTMNVSCDLEKIRETMCWNESLSATRVGSFNVESTGGNFTAECIATSVTKTLPSS